MKKTLHLFLGFIILNFIVASVMYLLNNAAGVAYHIGIAIILCVCAMALAMEK